MKPRTLAEHRRDVLNLTQQELAARAGCASNTLSDIEGGYLHVWRVRRKFYARLYGLPLRTFERLVRAGAKK